MQQPNKLLEIQIKLQKNATPLQAVIREEDCIGCTKCLPACPVDAIVGAAKHMHTVMTSECIGCQLCIEPCPVDCIEMVAVENSIYDPARVHIRYQAQQRRALEKKINNTSKEASPILQKTYIQEAVERVKARRLGLSPANFKNNYS